MTTWGLFPFDRGRGRRVGAVWVREERPPLRLDRCGYRLEAREEIDEPGAKALEDLARAEGSAADAGAVVARHLVLRLLHRVLDGYVDGVDLARERAAVLEYVAAEGLLPAERRALGQVACLAAKAPRPALAAALVDAGVAAATRGHDGGAFDLLLAAYRLAVSRGWAAEAARAAEVVTHLATEGRGPRSARLWRRRLAVWRRRAAEPPDLSPR